MKNGEITDVQTVNPALDLQRNQGMIFARRRHHHDDSHHYSNSSISIFCSHDGVTIIG
ncbi:hypothetical protein [Lactobacillus sp.]|uniref:hypothetical protein n=1 Tax=Lactobacillus sp. TaxID=1591 RepID=UPI00198F6F56|nr:hypothetical protein [Lactobacillus sp.]MBD5429007.1 hypothetical protein [Lactobacillus sp.]